MLTSFRLYELQNERSEEVPKQELEALKMESDTWALLQALMSYARSRFSLFLK